MKKYNFKKGGIIHRCPKCRKYSDQKIKTENDHRYDFLCKACAELSDIRLKDEGKS